MADEESLFPDLDLSELDEVELAETVASETKWTYVIDYRIRQMAINDDGRPKRQLRMVNTWCRQRSKSSIQSVSSMLYTMRK